MGIDQDDVIRILKLIEDSKNFDELNLQMGDLKLVVRKRGSAGAIRGAESGAAEIAKAIPAGKVSAAEPQPPDTSAQKKTEPVNRDVQDESGLIAIKSPMLGTFYRSSKPGAPPFVEVGSVVNVGDTLCIIEVMKLFNTTTAEIGGRIAKISAKDGQLVEFGQTLFLLEPAEKLGKGTSQ
jgi:acetyl-CoA carboxylase biotin carboxyl carrier protein